MKKITYIDELICKARSPQQLGEVFERFRLKEGKTQNELAKKAGLRQATVSSVEKGTPNTQIQTIFALCSALSLELVVRPRQVELGDSLDWIKVHAVK